MCELCDDPRTEAPAGARPIDRRSVLRGALAAGGATMLGSSLGATLLDALGNPVAAAESDGMFERAGMGEDPARFAAAGEYQAAGSFAPITISPGRIITRAQWGADESLRSGSPGFAGIRKCIVHHTVTPNYRDGASMCRSILRFHTQGNGWSDIGYNFLIDHVGNVFEGRWARSYAPGERHTGEDTSHRGVIGAHARNYNTGSAGIALL